MLFGSKDLTCLETIEGAFCKVDESGGARSAAASSAVMEALTTLTSRTTQAEWNVAFNP